jgi:hypothetical protein
VRAFSHALALAASLVAAAALAADDDPRETARELATSGIELYHQDRPEEAFARLERAEALFPAVTHRVYLARALVGMRRLVEAKARYEAIVAEPRPSEPPALLEAYAAAAAELEALEERLPRVRFLIAGEASAIHLDGRRLEPSELEGTIFVDPGEHRVLVEGATEIEERFTVVEGETREIAIAPPAITPAEPPGGSLVPAFVAFGLGGAALVVGAVTGGISLAKVADIEERCVGRHCRPEDEDEALLASRLGTTSTITFAIGGAAVAAGIVLVILQPGADRAAITPLVGPGFAGLQGRF